MDDAVLLRNYSENRSEEAFTELVRRHAGLVYSAARRQVLNPDLAQEVTQRTFVLMASKAKTLCRHPALVGWLYRTAGQVASEVRRAEHRRLLREQKAGSMDTLSTDSEHVNWAELAPCLDEAMSRLSEKDRLAILTRFFEDKPMREVGRVLGIREEAAKVRVGRALERLRGLLSRRGIVCSAGFLATVLAAKSVKAVPLSVLDKLTPIASSLSSTPSLLSSIQTDSLLAMSTTNLVKIGTAIAVLLLASITIHHLREQTINRGGSLPVTTFKSRLDPTAKTSGQQQSGLQNTSSPDPVIATALENLRNALYQPPSSAHVPYERIAPALAQFGERKRMALPLLVAALSDMNLTAQALAARGLALIGTDASAATPELLRLLKENRLAILNDDVVPLFTAVHPNPDIIPELLPLLGQPEIVDRSRIAMLIGALTQNDPAQADGFRGSLTSLLSSDEIDTRFYAALTFARLPGEKPATALFELGRALKLAQLQDPHAYDLLFDPIQNNTTIRDGEKFSDTIRRLQAVSALPSMGSEAKQFLPDLQSVARLTDEPQLRKSALLAIHKIDPTWQSGDPEIEQLLAAAEAGQRLVAKVRSGSADLDDLISGLRDEESAHLAAEELYKRGEVAQSAFPALEEATRKWGVYDAARALAKFAPEKLVVVTSDTSTINCVSIGAQVISESPSAFAGAASRLQATLERLDPKEIGARSGLAEAILAVDPQAPKPIYGFEDLEPAMRALDAATKTTGAEVSKQITDLRIRMFQDLNQKTRGEVINFLNALKQLDERVQKAFASKLPDPSLASFTGPK